MSDEETRNRRALKFRNKHAKELRENKAFRMKRVESQKKYRRKSDRDLYNEVLKKGTDDNEYNDD